MTQHVLWGDKPYHSLNYYLKQTYGCKVYKLSLDGGMTCPNRDGTLSYGGCIFCSEGGSGDFATKQLKSVTEQIEQAKLNVSKKIGEGGNYIAYFQSYTNTYAPISYLKKLFWEAISHPDIVCLSIATRPDCLSDEVLSLLNELNQVKPVWIELGLQTIHESTATRIRRGYELPCFDDAVKRLRAYNIDVIVHIILGLPGETTKDMLETVDYISHQPIQGVKLQLLHILKHTELAKQIDEIPIFTLEEYSHLIVQCIERIPPSMVIHRITGDGPKKLLLAPLWSANKKLVLNQLHKTMKEENCVQGKQYRED